MRNSTSRKVFALAAGCALTMAMAACGGDDGNGGGGGTEEQQVPLVFGTTENFVTADPAASYDWPSSLLLTNTAQTLLEVPPGGNEPVPEVAKSCEFTDPTTYTCKLKEGLKFADGSPLTSEDVKFSMDRMVQIKDDNGPWSLYDPQLRSTEAPDPLTVTYYLKYPDATWPKRLTYGGASIVPSDSYPADQILDSTDFVGSGPYQIVKYQPSSQIVLGRNPEYGGSKKPVHDQVIIQKYKDEASLKSAVETGDVHVAFRALSPTLIADLEKNGAEKGVQVLTGEGVGISYVVFNHLKGPFATKEVRQAFAYLVDREVIAEEVYNGTVEPLYTMVPSAFDGSFETFKDKYGTDPDPAAARALLQDAGVSIPVKSQLWWNPDHYGETSADMYAEIERQLEKDGLFEIELKSAAWDRYKEDSPKGLYPAYQLGWYPDFPDADNYLAPFYASENFMEEGQGYSDPRMDNLLKQEKSTAEMEKRLPIFKEIQAMGAEDVPTLPLWQDKMIAATRMGVTGVEDTFDAANQIRFWLIDATKAK